MRTYALMLLLLTDGSDEAKNINEELWRRKCIMRRREATLRRHDLYRGGDAHYNALRHLRGQPAADGVQVGGTGTIHAVGSTHEDWRAKQ